MNASALGGEVLDERLYDGSVQEVHVLLGDRVQLAELAGDAGRHVNADALFHHLDAAGPLGLEGFLVDVQCLKCFGNVFL